MAILAGEAPSAIATDAHDPGTAWEVEPVWHPGITVKKMKVEQVRDVSVLVTGAMPQIVVRRSLRANAPRLRACYSAGLAKNPDLHGTVNARHVISHTGEVTSVTQIGGTMSDAQVSTCVLKVFRGLSYPEPEGGGAVLVTTVHDFSIER